MSDVVSGDTLSIGRQQLDVLGADLAQLMAERRALREDLRQAREQRMAAVDALQTAYEALLQASPREVKEARCCAILQEPAGLVQVQQPGCPCPLCAIERAFAAAGVHRG